MTDVVVGRYGLNTGGISLPGLYRGAARPLGAHMSQSRRPHHGIPTTYKGVRMRSRLEARWACMFDALRWEWEYEPLDLPGWIPDFRLEGHLLVEVRPRVFRDGLTAKIAAALQALPAGSRNVAILDVPRAAPADQQQCSCWPGSTANTWLGDSLCWRDATPSRTSALCVAGQSITWPASPAHATSDNLVLMRHQHCGKRGCFDANEGLMDYAAQVYSDCPDWRCLRTVPWWEVRALWDRAGNAVQWGGAL